MTRGNEKSWIQDAVIYQVNLRGLAAREPRNAVEAAGERPLGESPLAYLTRNLGKLKRLGWTVLYLLPPYPIGIEGRKGIGSPYASRDFLDVEGEYGTKAELAELVRKAHRLGLRVILDLTPNHTARDHVWTKEHPEYYVHTPDGGLFYDCDWSDTAKLDYRNPALRQAMTEVYDHWLGLLGDGDGVDGFRLDMAHFINDRSYWDEGLAELRRRHPDRELLFLAECYGYGNNCDLFRRGMDAAYDDDFYKLAQYAYATDPEGGTVERLSDDAQHNHDWQGILDAWQDGGMAAAALKILLQTQEAEWLGGRRHYVARYTDNHDEGRGLYRFGAGGFRAMNTLAFLGGNALPFLLTGEEFGAVNRPPIHARCQPCDKGRRIVGEDGREWRSEGVETEGNVFARGLEARQEWYGFFRELVRLRKSRPELRAGELRPLDAGEDAPGRERTVAAFDRVLGRRMLRCAVNLGGKPRKLERADLFAGRTLYGGLGEGGVLAGYGAVVTVVE